MGIRKAMRKANLSSFNRGAKRIEAVVAKTKVPYLPSPATVPVKAGLSAARIFGTTVAAVKPALQATKGKKGGGAAAAVGAAGSAGFFAGSVGEAYRRGKEILRATPAPIRKAAAPAGGFVAGVVAVPLAARYLAPSAAANAAQAAATGALKLPGALAGGDGETSRPRLDEPGASGLRTAPDRKPSGKTKAGGEPVAKDAGEDRGQPRKVAAGGAANSRRRRGQPRKQPGSSGSRGKRGHGQPAGASRSRNGNRTPVVAPRSSDRPRSRSRRRGSGRGRGGGITPTQAKVLRDIEAQGFQVQVSPSNPFPLLEDP